MEFYRNFHGFSIGFQLEISLKTTENLIILKFSWKSDEKWEFPWKPPIVHRKSEIFKISVKMVFLDLSNNCHFGYLGTLTLEGHGDGLQCK
mgnify:CR=1 FL=1